jgi:transcriptional regulator with XRE-family HTH domain
MPKQRTAPNPNVGANILYLMSIREDLNSQPKLAARAGVGQTTCGRIIRGEVAPQADNLKKIADAFDCEVSFLYKNPDKFKEMASSGRRLRLPVGELQTKTIESAVETLTNHRVHDSNTDYSTAMTQRHRVLVELFEALPKSDQDELIKSLEDKKQRYQALLVELLSKKA